MNRCKRSAGLLWLAVLGLGLTACTKHEPVPLPDIKLNPNPIDRYEITIRIEDKVTPPKGLVGKVSYMVDNAEKCLPIDYTRAIGGVRPELYREQPLTYERVSDYVFRTYVYEDAVLNENYYGLAVCDWGIAVLAADIIIGSSIQKTLVGGDEIKGETLRVAFCPDNSQGNYIPDQSCISQQRFEQRDGEIKKRFYRIEILSKRIAP